MQFNNQLSFSSFNDAYQTFVNYYDKISLEKFLAATEQGQYVFYKISDIINNPPDNLDIKRLSGSPYPPNDRPRGIEDIKSVKYHMKSKCVSPIVIANYKKKEILLDGVHRLVAAKLSKKRIVQVYLIYL